METSRVEGPASLPPGTEVGPWRVVEFQGHGSYGIVYRAFRVGQEHLGPVALKLARYPWDPRFAREAELLSRLHHPSIPGLLDHGPWRAASGAEHPYLVIEWVEGTPLYAWAQQQEPSPEQLLRVVAQLARALATTHGANAVHRDVKGENIRVRRSDGRAMLIDFGSGHFQGASRLTWNSLPPGTADYRSPEACLFYLRSVGAPDAYFEATPADDLFALGVTAFRLITGQYPPALEPQRDEAGAWLLVREEVRPLLERHPRLDPLLREWMVRLLSLRAQERGTAVELAEALEAAAEHAGASGHLVSAHRADTSSVALARREVAAPPRPSAPQVSSGEVAPPKQAVRRVPALAWRFGRAPVTVGLCWMLVWALQAVSVRPERSPESWRDASSSDVPDAGPAAVGDSSSTAPLASVHTPSERERIAQNIPPKPRPGQLRPSEKGQCPGRKQVALNGACWVEQSSMTAEECAENGYAYHRGRCYAPALTPSDKPLPTSGPANAR
jgi:serine/threonine protein kinase